MPRKAKGRNFLCCSFRKPSTWLFTSPTCSSDTDRAPTRVPHSSVSVIWRPELSAFFTSAVAVSAVMRETLMPLISVPATNLSRCTPLRITSSSQSSSRITIP